MNLMNFITLSVTFLMVVFYNILSTNGYVLTDSNELSINSRLNLQNLKFLQLLRPRRTPSQSINRNFGDTVRAQGLNGNVQYTPNMQFLQRLRAKRSPQSIDGGFGGPQRLNGNVQYTPVLKYKNIKTKRKLFVPNLFG